MRGMHTQPERQEVTTTVRLPTEQYDALHAIARRDHRTFSHQLRFVVEQFIEGDEQERQAA